MILSKHFCGDKILDGKVINICDKKKILNDKYERCVICGVKTDEFVDSNIEIRNNYIYGIGQLCKGCKSDIKT